MVWCSTIYTAQYWLWGHYLGNTEEGCNVTHTFVNDDAVQEEHIRKGKEMHSDDMTDEEVLLDDENEDMLDDENEDMMDDEN